jgi:protein involved in polysaccharide export with SLBB domain
MAGGLQLNASNKLIIERTNLKTLQKEYIDVSLDDLLLEGSDLNNQIKLYPSDNIRILTIQAVDEYTVEVSGEVRNPGSFTWGPGLKLGDVIIQSGGIKPEAANSRVEISRVNVKGDGTGTEVIVAQFEININQQLVGGTDFELEKYDQIIVRSAPNFELQQNVIINGEVKFPGTYALLGDKETLISVLNRAGGLTEEAFPLGATLVRAEDGAGAILLDLDDVLDKKEKSVFNYVLKAGDQIVVPKVTDFIVLSGAVENPKIANVGKLNIPYHKGKRAGYYVNRYGQGVDRNMDGRRRYITVEYPNGDVKKTQNFGLFTVTPKVVKGSKITVGVKPPKPPKDDKNKDKEPIDWGEVIENSVAQVTAVLTLYVLLQRVF